jgi:hypothetical protein
MLLHAQRSHRYTLAFFGALVLAALLFGTTSASAQRRKKIVLSEFVIEGRVQKPQAFLLLQRQNLDFGSLELKRSFVPKILKSIEKKPF